MHGINSEVRLPSIWRSSEFNLADIKSHKIVVNADFNEDRPFFALSEYLAYADGQIRQSKRWADSSTSTTDGKNYLFPWHTVRGDIFVEGNEPVQMSFVLDKGRLLDLLVGHTIYNDPTVAVRELLQNAIDAVRYQHYLDKKEAASKEEEEPALGKVQVKWDSEERVLIVEDDGIGMDRDIIENHLMLVGASFYDTDKFRTENADFTPISRFGIGILTCFMVSDEIEIITCRGDGGYRIRMTSVHAEYLLKKLAPGDPELNGLEPHGTRVRIRIRSTVDLETKGMLDIVRHWVILPTCEVRYSEEGQEQQPIGFASIEKALHYYQFEDHGEQITDEKSYDILRSSIINGNEEYELAFAVKRGFFTPEQSFIEAHNIDAPAVCIEGIRVDNNLPGFITSPRGTHKDSICSLLSVKGNRRFRTNVSRMSLEVDEEYVKIAKLCTKILFEHIEKEVQRISGQEGHPLSTASTAALWIYSHLSNLVRLEEISNYLNSLYRKLPHIVIEKNLGEESSNTRELINQEQLEEIDTFWTIESRMVDYLGVISRDLGKELSFNDFFEKLAPDLQNASVNPIITDAYQFKSEIRSLHRVTKCEFNRKHQQTLLKWELLKGESTIDESIISLREFNQLFNRILAEIFQKATGDIGDQLRDNRNPKVYKDILVAPIEGDMDEVFGITTRMATILGAESEVAKVWISLKNAVEKLASNKERQEDLALLLAGCTIFEDACGSSSDRRFRMNHIWSEIVRQINDLPHDSGIDIALPENLDEILGEKDNWFDASKYWMSWFDWQKSIFPWE